MSTHVYGTAVVDGEVVEGTSVPGPRPPELTDRERMLVDLVKREMIDELQRAGRI